MAVTLCLPIFSCQYLLVVLATLGAVSIERWNVLFLSSPCLTDAHKKVIEEGLIQRRRQRSSLLFGGLNFYQFLAALAVYTRMILRKGWIALGWYKEKDELNPDEVKKRMNSLYSLKSVLVQNSWRGKELNTVCPPNISNDDLCLLFCINPSSQVFPSHQPKSPA